MKLKMAMKNLMERTWSSNSLSDSDKTRRVITCVELADDARLPEVASSILQVIFPRDQHQLLTLVEMGQSLRERGNWIGLCAQSVVAGIISNVRPDDDRWIALAADQLGESEEIIRGYLDGGHENLLLANLIHITRQILQSSSRNDSNRGLEMASASSIILPTLSNFDTSNTLPELKRAFGVLWEEIYREAPNNRVVMKIRDSLRGLRLPESDGLPSGWEVRQTPYDGRIYYIDHNMQRTTWTRPSDLPPYVAPHTSPSQEVLVSQQAQNHINRTPTLAVSSHLNAQPLESDGRPRAGASQAIASDSTITTANIAGSSGTAQPDPRSVLPASTHSATSVSVTPTARQYSQELDRGNSMRSFDHTDLNRDTSGNPA
ncbi:hypothetical protein BGW80DRAFT_381620 [Lactifluus volemus]|nr:hypothetical protein BGW80DRAFT_381620 [Lactifluus volemus]